MGRVDKWMKLASGWGFASEQARKWEGLASGRSLQVGKEGRQAS